MLSFPTNFLFQQEIKISNRKNFTAIIFFPPFFIGNQIKLIQFFQSFFFVYSTLYSHVMWFLFFFFTTCDFSQKKYSLSLTEWKKYSRRDRSKVYMLILEESVWNWGKSRSNLRLFYIHTRKEKKTLSISRIFLFFRAFLCLLWEMIVAHPKNETDFLTLTHMSLNIFFVLYTTRWLTAWYYCERKWLLYLKAARFSNPHFLSFFSSFFFLCVSLKMCEFWTRRTFFFFPLMMRCSALLMCCDDD